MLEACFSHVEQWKDWRYYLRIKEDLWNRPQMIELEPMIGTIL